MKVTIDQEKCIHCGLCKKACILTRFCGFDSLEQAAEQHCINCGHCVAVCPRQDVLQRFSAGDLIPESADENQERPAFQALSRRQGSL